MTGPSSAWSPVTSWPSTSGRGLFHWPSTTWRSEWQTPHAVTSTRCSPSPMVGAGRSTTTSGCPNAWSSTAFTRMLRRHGPGARGSRRRATGRVTPTRIVGTGRRSIAGPRSPRGVPGWSRGTGGRRPRRPRHRPGRAPAQRPSLRPGSGAPPPRSLKR